jgi:hypothetical protein
MSGMARITVGRAALALVAGVAKGVVVYSGQDADWDHPRCVDVLAVDGKKVDTSRSRR